MDQVGGQRDAAAAGFERSHRRALDVARGRLHVEGELARHVDAVGAGDVDVVGELAHGLWLDGDVLGAALAFLQVERAVVHIRGAVRHLERIGGGGAFDVVHGDVEACLVAERQEARTRRGQCHLVAHDHVFGRVSELAGAPGDRHDADGAIKVRQVEIDARRAVGADGDDARIERDGFLHGWVALQAGSAGVAARAQGSAVGAHAVDQPPVEVTDLQPHAPLGVEPAFGRGRLETRQVEDAEVDGRNRDAGLLAGIEAATS